jgi:hypothetical protein
MKISLDKFLGERPKLDPQALAYAEAQTARNCYLGAGGIRAIAKPDKDTALSLTSNKSIYKWIESGNSHWCESANDLDFALSPIAGESYDRVYYTGETEPRFLANDNVSSPFDFTSDFYKLGVPAPAAAPTVGSSAGGSTYEAYVYTYVNDYGEEGPPSAVGSITDFNSGNITIEDIEAAPSGRAISSIRLYRTNSSAAGVAEFQFALEATWFSASVAYAVGDFVIYGTDIYKCTTIHPAGAWNAGHFTAGDDIGDSDLGEVLPSENWDPPVSGLSGLIAMPNGIFAGFYGNKVYLSETYLPHAWPYSYSFDFDVVGIGFFGTTIVVMTEGNPYLLYGTDPDSMGKHKFSDFYPCTEKRSIAMGKDGVFYSSYEGLIRIDQSGIVNVTENLMDKVDWDDLDVDTIHGVYYQGKYIGFNDGIEGFILDFTNKTYTTLSTYAHSTHVATDGYLYIVEDDTAVVDEDSPPANMPLCVSQWEGDDINYLLYTWKSKEYIIPRKSFSAVLVILDDSFYADIQSNADLATLNASLFASDLDGELGGSVVNEYTINGDTLYDLNTISSGNYVTFTIYYDGTLIYTKTMNSVYNLFRIPGGSRARAVEFQLEGYPPVKKIAIAPSVEELEI